MAKSNVESRVPYALCEILMVGNKATVNFEFLGCCLIQILRFNFRLMMLFTVYIYIYIYT